jgi:sugar lactone lactonase YvrE
VRRLLGLAALVAALLASALPAAADAQSRPRWDLRVLANVPTPGFPALAYVHPNGRVYVGTYVNPKGDAVRSIVREYRGEDGLLLRSWAVPGQNLSGEHGVQVATSDARGRLVLLDHTPARALKLDRNTGDFSQYSTFADLAPCPAGQTGPNCSPTTQDLTPSPNYAAWGTDGSLYVTDYQQAVVWRIPPGGGAAQIWLADPRLDGGQFGTTGILLGADRHTLFIAQGSSGSPGGTLGALNPTTGKLYSVAIQPNGQPGGLNQLWESAPADLPDGFAIARSGRFYIPTAGGNQMVVVAPDGKEIERHSADQFDTPSSARFLGTRLIVANQAYLSGDQTKMAVLDVEVGEAGLPEFIPGLDLVDPVISSLSVRPNRFRTRARRSRKVRRRPAFAGRKLRTGTRIRFRLSEAARVTFRIDRRRGKRWRKSASFTRKRKAGRSSLKFTGRVRVRKKRRTLRPGRYRLVLSAEDPAGNDSKTVSRRFRIVR